MSQHDWAKDGARAMSVLLFRTFCPTEGREGCLHQGHLLENREPSPPGLSPNLKEAGVSIL